MYQNPQINAAQFLHKCDVFILWLTRVPRKNRRMTAPPKLPYERHRPQETLLYQLIETHYPEFRFHLETKGETLPTFVQPAFDDFLKRPRRQRARLGGDSTGAQAQRDDVAMAMGGVS